MDRRSLLVSFTAARVELQELRLALEEHRAQLAVNRELIKSRVHTARSCLRDRPHERRHSTIARLQGQLESLPAIEQAKGVLIAESGCTPEEAFDILRRASQRTNMKVRDLAIQIVDRAQGSRIVRLKQPGVNQVQWLTSSESARSRSNGDGG